MTAKLYVPQDFQLGGSCFWGTATVAQDKGISRWELAYWLASGALWVPDPDIIIAGSSDRAGWSPESVAAWTPGAPATEGVETKWFASVTTVRRFWRCKNEREVWKLVAGQVIAAPDVFVCERQGRAGRVVGGWSYIDRCPGLPEPIALACHGDGSAGVGSDLDRGDCRMLGPTIETLTEAVWVMYEHGYHHECVLAAAAAAFYTSHAVEVAALAICGPARHGDVLATRR